MGNLSAGFSVRKLGREQFARQVTALFTNMRILKFKSQLTIAFFAAVNHLNGPLRKQNFTLTGSKGQGLWFVIGGFWSVLCVSVFQGSLLVIVIMIDGSEKRNCHARGLLNFGVCMFVKSAVKHGLQKFFEYLCTLNTLQTRTILGQIKLGKQLPGGSK